MSSYEWTLIALGTLQMVVARYIINAIFLLLFYKNHLWFGRHRIALGVFVRLYCSHKKSRSRLFCFYMFYTLIVCRTGNTSFEYFLLRLNWRYLLHSNNCCSSLFVSANYPIIIFFAPHGVRANWYHGEFFTLIKSFCSFSFVSIGDLSYLIIGR